MDDELRLRCDLALADVGVAMARAGKTTDLVLHEQRDRHGVRLFAVVDRRLSHDVDGELALGMVGDWLPPATMLACLHLWCEALDRYFSE